MKKIPKEVTEYFSTYKRVNWVGVYSEKGYHFYYNLKKCNTIIEGIRITHEGKYNSTPDLYYQSMQGYRIDANNTREELMLEATQRKYFMMPDCVFINAADAIQSVNKYITKNDYIKTRNAFPGFKFYDFMQLIIENPKLEMIFKLDLHRFIKQGKKVNFEGKTYLQKFGFTQEWFKSQKSYSSNLSNYRKAYEKGVSVERIEYHQDFLRSAKIKGVSFEYYEKLQSDHYTIATYIDYYHLAKELNKDLKDKYWLEPTISRIKEKHDLLVTELNNLKELQELEKQKAYDAQYAKNIKKAKKIIGYTYDNINYLVPTKALELITEGRELKHCVGGKIYLDKHLKESLIVFARVDINKPLETIEIDLNKKTIIQCRGELNSPSEYHDKILKGANEMLALL